MSHRILTLFVAAVCAGPMTSLGAAQGEPATISGSKREIIPGSELMTSAEREHYRQRMRGARSADDESRLRGEHVKQMQERARLRGLRLGDPRSPGPAK